MRFEVIKAPSGVTGYRPEIDGLRALAVVPVVLYHAGVGAVSGGYVGVDVFFVISGFLITQILVREMEQGRYSILKFYQRRARRIFPALSVVVISTLIAGYLFLTPRDFVDVAKSGIAISIFASNFYFMKSVDYFSVGTAITPLLHTWSLAVEEQFYIVFPPILYLLMKRRQWLVPALLFCSAASLVLAMLLIPTKPMLAFYMLPMRAWELSLGSLVAIGVVGAPTTTRKAEIASLCGFAMIVAPMLLYTSATPFPGLAAVPPCLGAALIIWSNGMGRIAKLLSLSPFLLVGQASYSLYLWHLPVLEFAHYLVAGPLPLSTALALCAVSLLLALASLKWVERPFREGRAKLHPTRMAVAAFASLWLLAGVSFAIVAMHGLPSRISPLAASQVAIANDMNRHHVECMTIGARRVPPAQACLLGTKGVAPSILLWGDSHAMVTATALEGAAVRNGGSFLFAADADCPVGKGFLISRTVNPQLTKWSQYGYCEPYNAAMLQRALDTPSVTTVMLSARWTGWRIGAAPNPAEPATDIRLVDASRTATSAQDNRLLWERGFLSLLDTLHAAGKKVVIVGPLPEPAFNVPHKAFVEQFGFTGPIAPITLREFEQRHATILTFFASLKGRPDVLLLWPHEALCLADGCPIMERGRPLYFDQDHLSVLGAGKTSRLYDVLFKPAAVAANTTAGRN